LQKVNGETLNSYLKPAMCFGGHHALVFPLTPKDVTLHDYASNLFKRNEEHDNVEQWDWTLNELPVILYQIYHRLSQLDGVFAHYDLHAGNVLVKELYCAITNKCRKVAFDDEFSFCTRFDVPRLIDFGTSFVSTLSPPMADDLHQQNKRPKPSPTEKQHLEKYKQLPFERYKQHCMTYDHMNPSHDLKLLYDLRISFYNEKKWHDHPFVREILLKIKYGWSKETHAYPKDKRIYGTFPIETCAYPKAIHNIHDAARALKDFIQKHVTPGYDVPEDAEQYD
jgi:hypothetical protein